jgi:quercetin dioxygenase-like cupin family protein
MNLQDFEEQLKAENFGEITTVQRATGYALHQHEHPFHACALITAGNITLVVDGVATRYGVGDVFRLPAGKPHGESAGPDGVSYRVGRRLVVQ